jgi:hypothetical protein
MLSLTFGVANADDGECEDLQAEAKADCMQVKAMSKAWFDYLKAVKSVTKDLQMSPNYQTDPTGMLDIQTGMVLTNITANMSSSGSGIRGQRPRWSSFDTPDVRIGIDNADTRYLATWIPNGDGQQVYRVYGNRSNSCDMIVLVNDPTSPTGGGDTIEDENMFNTSGGPLGPNEDYEVFLSTADKRDPAWHNWLEIGASDGLNISHRYTVCNYHTERPGDVHVERIGTEGVAMTAEEFRNPADLTTGIERATATMINQQPFWGTFSDIIINSGLPANVIAPWGLTGGLGITTQLSNTSWIDLADDQALVIKMRTDYPGAYGSMQLFNAWGSSLPWGHHMANGSFEVERSAGNSYFLPSAIAEPVPPQVGGMGEEVRYTYIVVSNQDPGVHNWIGTMGHRPIFAAGRLQSVLDPDDVAMVSGVGPWMPLSFVVPLAAIFPGSPALAPDMAFVTPEERAAQIRERQVYQQEKYAPW